MEKNRWVECCEVFELRKGGFVVDGEGVEFGGLLESVTYIGELSECVA